jgi:hypothetical protein
MEITTSPDAFFGGLENGSRSLSLRILERETLAQHRSVAKLAAIATGSSEWITAKPKFTGKNANLAMKESVPQIRNPQFEITPLCPLVAYLHSLPLTYTSFSNRTH